MSEFVAVAEVTPGVWSTVRRDDARPNEPNYQFPMTWHDSEQEAMHVAKAMGIPIVRTEQ